LVQQIGLGGSATSLQIGAVTPHEAGDLVVSMVSTANAMTTATIDSSFGTVTKINPAVYMPQASAWLSAANTTPINPTWTTDAADLIGMNAVFRAAGAPPTTVTQPFAKSVVGNGVEACAGSGGLGPSANVDYPGQMVIDSHGLVIFANVNCNVIQAYNPTAASITAYGQTIASLHVTTIAGNGTLGFVDNVTPLSAEFAHPVGLAIDQSNDCIFVADQQNHAARKFCPGGNVTTVAGRGSGGGVVSSCGSTATGGFSGDGGDPLLALLACPQGLWYDQTWKVLHIADTNNNRDRPVNFDSVSHVVNGVTIAPNTIKTVYGDGTHSCQLTGAGTTSWASWPLGLTGDTSHNIYMVIINCHQVIKLDVSGVPSVLAGNGTLGHVDNVAAPSAEMAYPFDIDLALNGDFFIADAGNALVRWLDHTDGKLKTLLGNFALYPYTATTAWFSGGCCANSDSASLAGIGYVISVHADNLGGVYTGDIFNSRIWYVYNFVPTPTSGQTNKPGITVTSGVTWQ